MYRGQKKKKSPSNLEFYTKWNYPSKVREKYKFLKNINRGNSSELDLSYGNY